MNIKGLDKAELLRRLYNAAEPMGMGFLQARRGDLSKVEAEELLKKCTYFDYLYGRPLKIDLSGVEVNTFLYNRDQGTGKAERIINQMRIEAGE